MYLDYAVDESEDRLTPKWAVGFYQKQYTWLVQYRKQITHISDARICQIQRLTNTLDGKLLDLGSGDGNFALAAARLGFDIVAIEIIPAAARALARAAASQESISLTVVNLDFYDFQSSPDFDIICYWDGFGISSDIAQKTLIAKSAQWLTCGGSMMIEVFTPWYWANVASGVEMNVTNDVKRSYRFDARGCRMEDTWWRIDDSSERVTQSLRCYSPADLELLLEGLPLVLESVESNGMYNHAKQKFYSDVPLEYAMSYTARIVRRKS